MELVTKVVSLLPLGRLLSARSAAPVGPAKDRAALATAFIAKAVLNLPTTRDLMSRLRVDEALRQLCGWPSVRAMPHESKFSRAFAEFASVNCRTDARGRHHQHQGERLIGHIARDSTAISGTRAFPGTSPGTEA